MNVHPFLNSTLDSLAALKTPASALFALFGASNQSCSRILVWENKKRAKMQFSRLKRTPSFALFSQTCNKTTDRPFSYSLEDLVGPYQE